MAIGRRGWMKAAAAGVAWPAWARGDGAEEVQARAEAVGLGKLGRSEAPHYVAIGNARKEFRDAVVAACEAMAEEFVRHFKAKGFEVAPPSGRMIVVVLADAKSYARFVGESGGLAVGGQYEPATNRLVIFDYRSSQEELAANAERINSFTLGHETNHQLSFNVGLLNRAGDVPLCISEGLATYGETWRPGERDSIGRVNHPRLKGLEGATPWIRMARLFAEDHLLDDAATRDAAYAQSWVLIHAHMKDPARLPKLRAYLGAIRGRKDASHRLDDAREHLGDLDKLDLTLRKWAKAPKGR